MNLGTKPHYYLRKGTEIPLKCCQSIPYALVNSFSTTYLQEDEIRFSMLLQDFRKEMTFTILDRHAHFQICTCIGEQAHMPHNVSVHMLVGACLLYTSQSNLT